MEDSEENFKQRVWVKDFRNEVQTFLVNLLKSEKVVHESLDKYELALD